MLKPLMLFLSHRKGVISIEFSIIFPFLIYLFLLSFEFARIIFIGSSIDLLTTEISRKVAISESKNIDYSETFYHALSNEVPLWPFLTSSSDFNVSLQYCKNLNELVNGDCNAIATADDKIIFFTLKYQYSDLLGSFFSQMIDSSLTKKVVVYREFR